MIDEVPGVMFPPDVLVKITEAELRVIAAARRYESVRRDVVNAVSRGDLLLSSAALLELKEVRPQPQRQTPRVHLPRQVQRDLELLRVAAVVHRVAVHGVRLVARAARWDGTVKGAHDVSTGLLEPDLLG